MRAHVCHVEIKLGTPVLVIFKPFLSVPEQRRFVDDCGELRMKLSEVKPSQTCHDELNLTDSGCLRLNPEITFHFASGRKTY